MLNPVLSYIFQRDAVNQKKFLCPFYREIHKIPLFLALVFQTKDKNIQGNVEHLSDEFQAFSYSEFYDKIVYSNFLLPAVGCGSSRRHFLHTLSPKVLSFQFLVS